MSLLAQNFSNDTVSPSKEKHRERLARLNMLHSNNLLDLSFSSKNDTSSNSFGMNSNNGINRMQTFDHKLSGRMIVSGTYGHHQYPKENPQTCEKEEPKNSPTIKKISKRKLSMSLADTEALLRVKIDSPGSVCNLRKTVNEFRSFLHEIKELAIHYQVLEGTLFQEILFNCKSNSSNSCAPRSRNGKRRVYIKFDDLMPLVDKTEKLINFIRVKIEDDNDLNLARQALNETYEFLHELAFYAKEKKVDEYDLIKQLR